MHQFYSIGTFFIFAFLSTTLTDYFIHNQILSFFISGFIYSILIFIVIKIFPSLIGLTKKEIVENFRAMTNFRNFKI
jgi:hypothetical protein